MSTPGTKKKIEALILEGAEQAEIKKKAEKRLEAIKAELIKLGHGTAGVHVGSNNSVLTVSEKETWINPEPKELYDALKAQRKSALFWKCVVVQTKAATETLGDEVFRSFQSKGKPQQAFSFKK